MIKLIKGQSPQVLIDNQTSWTSELRSLMDRYGSYGNIPEKEKNAVVNRYKHVDIKNALEHDPGGCKCVYCESFLNTISYSNIEHYHPKSICPDETFCWNNLFMACTVCNTTKEDFDTQNEPFINPLTENPEDYLTFDELRIVPKNNNHESTEYKKANNVIQNCKLQRRSLTREYAKILESFYEYVDALNEAIIQYNKLSQIAAKRRKATQILESLDLLKEEASINAEYAAYMRYLLRKFAAIRQAIEIINQYSGDLVPNTGFDLGFI